MLLVLGVEVRTRRRKCRPFALGHGMNVQGVFAGRQVFEIQPDGDTAFGFGQDSGAHALPLAILQIVGDRCGGRTQNWVVRSGITATYLVMVPQAIRSPALPAGSDFKSSALA